MIEYLLYEILRPQTIGYVVIILSLIFFIDSFLKVGEPIPKDCNCSACRANRKKHSHMGNSGA